MKVAVGEAMEAGCLRNLGRCSPMRPDRLRRAPTRSSSSQGFPPPTGGLRIRRARHAQTTCDHIFESDRCGDLFEVGRECADVAGRMVISHIGVQRQRRDVGKIEPVVLTGVRLTRRVDGRARGHHRASTRLRAGIHAAPRDADRTAVSEGSLVGALPASAGPRPPWPDTRGDGRGNGPDRQPTPAVSRWDDDRDLARVLSEPNRDCQGLTIAEPQPSQGHRSRDDGDDLVLEERCQESTMYRIFKQTEAPGDGR